MIAPRTRHSLDDSVDHRWGPRISCRANVRIRAADGTSGAGQLREVSSSGAFIETAFPIPVLASITIGIVRGDPLAGTQNDIRASVVRRDRNGIAIEWCETPECSICTGLGCESHCAAALTPR